MRGFDRVDICKNTWYSISCVYLLGVCFFLWGMLSTPVLHASGDSKGEALTYEKQLNEMHILSVKEGDLHGHPALVVTFSQALDPKSLYNDFLSVYHDNLPVSGSWVFSDNERQLFFTAIKPSTAYYLSIQKGLKAANGLELMASSEKKITTRAMEASVDFATKGSVLPPHLTQGIPLRVVNVKEVDVEFLRVKPEKIKTLTESINFNRRLNRWRLQEISKVADSVYMQRFVTGAKENTRTTTLLSVEDVEALQKPGIYFVILRTVGDFSGRNKVMYFTVSDIGLHLRRYNNTLEVFASSLLEGKPLQQVALELKGKNETLRAITDNKGRATFTRKPEGNLLLLASKGEQVSFVDMRLPALDLSEFDVTGEVDQALMPFVYSSRNLYRPNESVRLSILLRGRDGQLVDTRQLHVTILSPDNKTIFSTSLKADALGYYQHRFNLPQATKTGRWMAEVRLHASEKKVLARWPFQVEHFIPERMRLQLDSAQKVIHKGDAFQVQVQGDYLYGAPAAGNTFDGRYAVAVEPHPLKDF